MRGLQVNIVPISTKLLNFITSPMFGIFYFWAYRVEGVAFHFEKTQKFSQFH